MVNRILIRIVGLCAACMLPTLAFARSHDSGGFYIGVGAHTNGAEVEFSRVFTEASNLTVSAPVTAVFGDEVISTVVVFGVAEAGDTATVSIESDEDSDFGYGVHVGYKINEFFSVEVSYAEIGEYTGKFDTSIPATPVALAAGVTTVANIDGSGTHSVDVSAFSGAVLGSYPLADNASVFGRLGYYSTDISESLSWSGAGDLAGEADNVSVTASFNLNRPLLEDASGLLYGAGLELAFGSNRNILVRGEFNVLSDGLGEIDDITQFGLTASWKF